MIFEYNVTKDKMLSILKNVHRLVKRYDIPFVYVLLHKIDKMRSAKKREKLLARKKAIIDTEFGLDVMHVFGTSIHPDFFKKFRFTLTWMLAGLQISVPELPDQFENDLRKLRTLPDDRIKVNLADDALAEIPSQDHSSEETDEDYKELKPEEMDSTWQD